jgi:hypothetical protein
VRAVWEYELPGSLITPFRVPQGAVDALFDNREHFSGPIFTDLRFGGYLEYREYPYAAFIDGRMILRSADFYRRFLEVVDHPELFPEYRKRYGFVIALLPLGEDGRFLRLAGYLYRTGWSLIYSDGAAAVLVDPAVYPELMHVETAYGRQALVELSGKRFAANPRLFRLALRNQAAFLRAAGKDSVAASLEYFIPDPSSPQGGR